jgi:hypothetical protein
LAIALLERGASRLSDRWEFFHDIGFVHAWNYRDYPQAARWFERASQRPGAPIWLKSTAASMLLKGGDRQSARQLWQQLYEDADLAWLKTAAETHLAQFDALDTLDELNEIVWRYQAKTGRMPQAWDELVAARVLRSVPLDPAGVPFELDLVNESVRLARRSPLWPLPEGFVAAVP